MKEAPLPQGFLVFDFPWDKWNMFRLKWNIAWPRLKCGQCGSTNTSGTAR